MQTCAGFPRYVGLEKSVYERGFAETRSSDDHDVEFESPLHCSPTQLVRQSVDADVTVRSKGDEDDEKEALVGGPTDRILSTQKVRFTCTRIPATVHF